MYHRTVSPRRSIATAIASLIAIASLAACSSGASEVETTTPVVSTPASESPSPTPVAPVDPTAIAIASLKGPTTMGLVGMTDPAATFVDDYTVTMYGAPDEIVPLVAQGQVDVALIPSNLAAVLYNKTKGTDAQISVAAINTLGVLNIVETGDTVKTLADLKGKTIYSTGKGASPEYVLNYLLTQAGLTPGTDVTVNYLTEHSEVVQTLASTPGAIGVLPQPFVTIAEAKTPGLHVALDLTEEWAAVSPDSQLITGVLVVRNGFVTEHPEAFERFLADYSASTDWVNASPAEAAPLIAEAGIVPEAAIAEKAIPKCYITYIAGADMKSALSGYLQVLFNADPKSVGGAMPGDDFYYGG